MRVPSLRPGTHTLKLTVDTKTPFGVLTGERSVIIEDQAIIKLQNDCISARAKGNTARAAAITRQLIARRFSHSIKPGRPIPIDKPGGTRYAPSGKVKANITWYPGKDQLRVLVNVTDPKYAALSSKNQPGYACIDIFICPTGVDRDICMLFVAEVRGRTQCAVRVGRQGYERNNVAKAVWKHTPTGYRAEVNIPWSVLRGLPANWTGLPVQAIVMGPGGGKDTVAMSKPDDPSNSARGYLLLTRK